MINTNEQLSNKNTRPTSMRVLVYDVLSNAHTALSISEIEQRLSTADRTTIYRTLKTFEAKGIAHEIKEDTISKYTLCCDDCNETAHKDWHLHFYCKLCKTTSCRTDVIIPDGLKTDLRIDEVNFFAKGVCEDCLS